MPNSKFRFTVTTAGAPRVFLSGSERASSDLTLFPKTRRGQFFGFQNSVQIVNHRFSVHSSPASPTYNTIKQTIILANGKKVTSALVTDALKRSNSFALLYVKLGPELRHAEYVLNAADKAKRIDLGLFDSERFNFCHAVVIGPKGVQFDAERTDFNVSVHEFALCNLIILSSFLTVPNDGLHLWRGTISLHQFSTVRVETRQQTPAAG